VRVVSRFPNARLAPSGHLVDRKRVLPAARLRHIAGTAWSFKRYRNLELLKDQQMRGAIIA
jgi:hypothetical protein